MSKHVFLLALVGVAISALAFSLGPPGYVPPPPRPHPPLFSITNEYRLATGAMGPAANQFHCIRTNGNLSFLNQGEWLFIFSNTNGHIKAVYVLRNFIRDQADTNNVTTVVFDNPQNE